jgi:hypothetical protein
MPRTHGKGAKFGFVRKYWRWQSGHIRLVGNHPRGASSRPRLTLSDLQLDFGFQ